MSANTITINTKSLNSIYIPLRLAFGLVPLLAGIDKFTNILANWQNYLPSYAADILPMSPATFMMIVGVIEIIAGLAVLTVLTRLGAYVVMAWLLLIAITVATAGYLDIAVRDIVMAIAAFTLGQVAGIRGEHWLPRAAAADASHASRESTPHALAR